MKLIKDPTTSQTHLLHYTVKGKRQETGNNLTNVSFNSIF